LYGYERGAFTGAENRKRGRIELAHGGTLFLDEIGELSLTGQMKLLRVLQERKLERLGAETSVHVDVRIIAATHKDLESAMTARTFREDLYYRIDVFSIFIPPLRDRRVDIPQLAYHFVSRFAAEHGKGVTEISPEAMSLLAGYSWPGNVRELQNVIERAVIVSKDSVIRRGDLPSPFRSVKAAETEVSLCDASVAFEKRMIEEALRSSQGCKAKSARLLGTTERVVSYKIRKYSIDCSYFKE
jgi:Nif-specific regulatory protein